MQSQTSRTDDNTPQVMFVIVAIVTFALLLVLEYVSIGTSVLTPPFRWPFVLLTVVVAISLGWAVFLHNRNAQLARAIHEVTSHTHPAPTLVVPQTLLDRIEALEKTAHAHPAPTPPAKRTTTQTSTPQATKA